MGIKQSNMKLASLITAVVAFQQNKIHTELPIEEYLAATLNDTVQDKGFFDPTSLKRLVRYVNLAQTLLDTHYTEKVATVWKARFNKSANNMLIAYDRCGLGAGDLRRRKRETKDMGEEVESFERAFNPDDPRIGTSQICRGLKRWAETNLATCSRIKNPREGVQNHATRYSKWIRVLHAKLDKVHKLKPLEN